MNHEKTLKNIKNEGSVNVTHELLMLLFLTPLSSLSPFSPLLEADKLNVYFTHMGDKYGCTANYIHASGTGNKPPTLN